MPLAAAIARPVQWVASPGGSARVSSMTRSIIAGGNGGRPGFRVLSCSRPHPFAHEPLLPAPYTRLRDPGASHDLGGATVRRGQNDPRPPHMLLRAVAIGCHRGQSLAVGGTHVNADRLAHPASLHRPPQYGIL